MKKDSKKFKLISKYEPTGDQPEAIKKLVSGVEKWYNFQSLLGITGSGKTFTVANVIEKIQKPTLILAHNKTLAAQLAQEFKAFFPENAVHYFVSYYDYYQPEAYIAKSDTYIEKESSINEEIDRLRHAATQSLLTRNDVIIVASVSCIFGIGNKDNYTKLVLELKTGKDYEFESILDDLVRLQFNRAWNDFKQGMFQVLGDTIEIFPASMEYVYTLEFFGNHLEKISVREPITGNVKEVLDYAVIFPASHTVTTKDQIKDMIPSIKEEAEEREKYFIEKGDIVRAERIKMKTEYDVEMMTETWYVRGIENYSMYLDNRSVDDPPTTLIDFFPKDFFMCIDESHITVPQIGGMYGGDASRKKMLIEHGFRLPSARANRPLTFQEFEKKLPTTLFISATPAEYEQEKSDQLVEQIIRPTWLLDPEITIEDMECMSDDLMKNISLVVKKNQRALITTLTKRMSEDLTEFLRENGVKVQYLHSDVDTIDRLEILKSLREWEIHVIVGVNLLREGLDLPEVSFIGILDAEKQGFLRSTTSLIQIIGRAARNSDGRVTMYSRGKIISRSMKESIDITQQRRDLQIKHNEKHGIIPTTIISRIKDIWLTSSSAKEEKKKPKTKRDIQLYLKRLEVEMDVAAANQQYEEAAKIRDEILELKKKL